MRTIARTLTATNQRYGIYMTPFSMVNTPITFVLFEYTKVAYEVVTTAEREAMGIM